MKIFFKYIDGFKVKFCCAYFCIGIGMDQFTPVYYRYITGQSLGSFNRKKELCETANKIFKS